MAGSPHAPVDCLRGVPDIAQTVNTIRSADMPIDPSQDAGAFSQPGSVSRSSARHYPWGTGCHGWHFLERDDVSVILEEVPPGASELRHYHESSRQFFFILAGTASFELDGRHITLAAEEGIEVAPRIPHRLVNASDGVLRFLVVSMPKSHGDRIVVP